MNKINVALGSREKFVKLGNFNMKFKNDTVNLYYNMDCSNNLLIKFDGKSHTYCLNEIHQSFHYSGQCHIKEKGKKEKLSVGTISDSSVLNTPSMDPLILGIESFFNIPFSKDMSEKNTIFLNLSSGNSILWLLVPAIYSRKVLPRLFYKNKIFFNFHDSFDAIQTISLNDMLITEDMKTILTVNGWEVRALFLKSLLSTMIPNTITWHLRNIEKPWRAWSYLDQQLSLDQMMQNEFIKRKLILIPKGYQIPKTAQSPMNWVKQ